MAGGLRTLRRHGGRFHAAPLTCRFDRSVYTCTLRGLLTYFEELLADKQAAAAKADTGRPRRLWSRH